MPRLKRSLPHCGPNPRAVQSRTADTNGIIEQELEETLVRNTRLDPRLNSLIVEVETLRRCDSAPCVVVMVIKRAEASLLYRKAVSESLTTLRQHVNTGLASDADLFDFAGSVNAAQKAYRQLVNAQYRLKAIDKTATLGLTKSDETNWQRLIELKAKRLAKLKVAVAPTSSIEFSSDTTVSGVPIKNGKFKDAELGRSISDAIAKSLTNAQVRANVAGACTNGVMIIPKGVLTCGNTQGYTQCGLEINGEVATCDGRFTRKSFTIRERKKLRGVVESAEYSRIRRRLLQSLDRDAVKALIVETLSRLLPSANTP